MEATKGYHVPTDQNIPVYNCTLRCSEYINLDDVFVDAEDYYLDNEDDYNIIFHYDGCYFLCYSADLDFT